MEREGFEWMQAVLMDFRNGQYDLKEWTFPEDCGSVVCGFWASVDSLADIFRGYKYYTFFDFVNSEVRRKAYSKKRFFEQIPEYSH